MQDGIGLGDGGVSLLVLQLGDFQAQLAFLAVAVQAPVDVGYERYSAEFIGRVDLSTYPADVLLAACGAAWLWRAGFATRIASAALVIWAVMFAARYWIGWLR